MAVQTNTVYYKYLLVPFQVVIEVILSGLYKDSFLYMESNQCEESCFPFLLNLECFEVIDTVPLL